MKVVCNDAYCFATISPHVDPRWEEWEGIDIETRVDLVEKDIFRIPEGNLKELYTTLLSTWKSDKKITIEKVRSEPKIGEKLLYHTTKDKSGWKLLIGMKALKVRIIDRSEILSALHSWNLRNILKGEKESSLISCCWRKRADILTFEEDISCCMISRMSCKSKGERRLPWTIVSEKGCYHTLLKCIWYIMQDGLGIDGYWEVYELDHKKREIQIYNIRIILKNANKKRKKSPKRGKFCILRILERIT
jgi:hypothetical protein